MNYFWGDSVAQEPVAGLTSEGFAWCADLTQADGYGVLSAALSLGLLANVGFSVVTQPVMGKWKTRFTRSFALVSIVAFPLTLKMPAVCISELGGGGKG